MLGSVSTLMCVSVTECLLPGFCSFQDHRLVFQVFSVQSGEGRVLVSPNNETRTWTLCRMSVFFLSFYNSLDIYWKYTTLCSVGVR